MYYRAFAGTAVRNFYFEIFIFFYYGFLSDGKQRVDLSILIKNLGRSSNGADDELHQIQAKSGLT